MKEHEGEYWVCGHYRNCKGLWMHEHLHDLAKVLDEFHHVIYHGRGPVQKAINLLNANAVSNVLKFCSYLVQRFPRGYQMNGNLHVCELSFFEGFLLAKLRHVLQSILCISRGWKSSEVTSNF